MNSLRRHTRIIIFCLLASLFSGPAAEAQRPTRRDRAWKVTGIGAAGTYLKGKREADAILAGAAIGGVVGGAVGVYMDRQQERLVHIRGTSVERTGEDTLLIHFDADVLFGAGSASLDRAGRRILEQVAEVINDYRKTAVVVQGHTERRARAVESYLASRGVDSSRMTSIGFGESAPVASNDTSGGRQRNRRVDVLLKVKSGPLRQG